MSSSGARMPRTTAAAQVLMAMVSRVRRFRCRREPVRETRLEAASSGSVSEVAFSRMLWW